MKINEFQQQNAFERFRIAWRFKPEFEYVNFELGEDVKHLELDDFADPKATDPDMLRQVMYILEDLYERGAKTGANWFFRNDDLPPQNYNGGDYVLEECQHLGLKFYKGYIDGHKQLDEAMLAATQQVWDQIAFIAWAKHQKLPEDLIQKCLKDPSQLELIGSFSDFGFFD